MNNDVIIYEQLGNGGNIGFIELNRPKALNAINLDMAKLIYKKLCHWDHDPNIKAIIIRSKNESAFCAGGDLKALYHGGTKYANAKFWHEYRLIAKIASLTKPYIALLHGITMGGGVGIGINGSFRIACSSLKFAMPESSIGFFPDVGASYFLSKAPGKTGLYLGITGNSINASDALYCGFVDYIIDRNDFSSIIENINKNSLVNPKATLHKIFQEYAKEPELSKVEQDQELIEKIFGAKKISESIKDAPDEWQKCFNYNSPNSMAITEEIHKNKISYENLNLALMHEFQIACNLYAGNDFREGIRAKIIDKDMMPKWQDEYSTNFLLHNNPELDFDNKSWH